MGIGQQVSSSFQPVLAYSPTPTGVLTGQITGTVAGTPQRGPNIQGFNGFLLVAHPDNTDVTWVFSNGLTKASGYPISTSFQIVLDVENLNEVAFDVDVSGEKLCWLKL